MVTALGTAVLRAQETGGTLTGTAKDPSGAVISGASVTITEKSTGRVTKATTGSDGAFYSRSLPPGAYSVRYDMSGFAPSEFQEIVLLLGKTLRVDATMQVATIQQAVTVVEESPQIDLSSTTIGHSVSADELDRLPKSRSFQGMLLTSPSVTSGVDQNGNIVSIEGGFQVNGASSGENQFNIDGISTNSVVNGRSRQNATLEFVQEVQVKTGGVEAEYGGAIGGVLSAVTKSGGNQFHGGAWYYLGGNKLSAGPIQRLLLDPTTERTAKFVQDDKYKDNRNEVGGEFGGPLLKDRMWFYTAMSPQWRRRTNNYLFNNGKEPDSINQKSLSQSAFSKLSYDPTSRIRTNFTFLWTPEMSTGRLPSYDGEANSVVATKTSNQINKQIGYFNPKSSFTGEINATLSNRAVLTVRGGRFWDDFKDTGIPDNAAVEYRIPTASLGALEANIPVAERGGTGFLNTPRLRRRAFEVSTRTQIQADLGVNANMMGNHDLKIGIGTMKNINKVEDSYPGGGYFFIFWNSTYTGTGSSYCTRADNRPNCRGTYGYYEYNELATRGTVGANVSNIYAQDRWRIHPRLTINYGVRFEKETIPSFKRFIKQNAIQFDYTDKIAPRLGFSYDYFGNGKLKLAASWGRFYDWVKYEVARGTFGAEVWNIYYRTLDSATPFSFSSNNVNVKNLPGNDIWNPGTSSLYRDRRIPAFDAIAPGIKPMSSDNMNAGFDYQLSNNTVFSAYYVHTGLRRTIEDLGALDAAGNEVYYYANPGEGVAKITPASGATTKAIPTPKPTRTYNAMELKFDRRFSNGWSLNASYVLSRLYGNYSGIAATEEVRPPTSGVSSPATGNSGGAIVRQAGNANRAYDIDELLFDSHGKLDVKGRLPTDRPHQFKAYAAKEMKWSERFGTSLVGAFWNIASGTPLSTYVNTTNQTEVFVEGRGSMGRSPVLSTTDLLYSHSFNISEGKKLSFEFNMTNLFNQKTARHRYPYLNRGGAGSVRASSAINLSRTDLYKGYDYKALIAATPDAATATGALDPRYGMDDIWSPGFSGRFGVKFTF